MGACFGKKCEAAVVVPSCHPCRLGTGAVLRLFAVELCPSTASIRMALHHKALPVDAVWIPPPDGGDAGSCGVEGGGISAAKLDWLLSTCGGSGGSIVGNARFPILQHGNAIVNGSADDVLDYIDSTFRDPPLQSFPEGDERSGMDIRDWVDFIRTTLAPLLKHALYDLDEAVSTGGADGGGEVEELAARLESAYAKLDRGLYEHNRGAGPYFFGAVLTMVDIYLVPLLELLRPLAFFRGLELRPLHSQLAAYCTRCVHFPSYATARLDPDLLDMSVSKAIHERSPPPLVALTMLQHRSIAQHLSRIVEGSRSLAECRLDNATSPVKAATAIELKRLANQYVNLVQIMQEHAQMEERSIFPAIEEANTELTAAVHSDHARDLPIMNGIREDLKSVMSLQQGSGIHGEALVALATRLKIFQDCTRDHFAEEERDIIPLLETVGFAAEQQCSAMEDGFVLQSLMELSHGRLFPFLLQGLQPHEMHQYVSILQRSLGSEKTSASCLRHVLESGSEYSAVRKSIRQRFPSLCDLVPVKEDSLHQVSISRKLDEELSTC